MNKILILITSLTLSACVTIIQDIGNKIDIGMTKTEVINKIGEPSSLGSDGQLQYLTYFSFDKRGAWTNAPEQIEYVIALKDGKVIKFGTAAQIFGTNK